MSKQCKIIEDLLPLYHDGVCSEESRELVDEHLAQCEKCRKALGQIDRELEMPAAHEDMEPLKNITKTVNKGKRKALFTGISVALIMVLLLCAGRTAYWYTQEYLYYIDFAQGHMPDSVYQFDENGNIVHTVVVNPDKYSWDDDAYRYDVEVPQLLSNEGRVVMTSLEDGEKGRVSVSIGRWKDKAYVFHVSFMGTVQQWMDQDGRVHIPYLIVDSDMNLYYLDHWTQEVKEKMAEDLAIYKDEIQQLIKDAKAMWPFME